jgi:hypothetical protein
MAQAESAIAQTATAPEVIKRESNMAGYFCYCEEITVNFTSSQYQKYNLHGFNVRLAGIMEEFGRFRPKRPCWQVRCQRKLAVTASEA